MSKTTFTGLMQVTSAFLNKIFKTGHRHDGLDQDGSSVLDYVAASGSVNAFELTFSPVINANITGFPIRFKVNNTNTGACTLKIDSATAKPIKKNISEALVSGDLVAGEIVEVSYDGTNYQLVSMSKREVIMARLKGQLGAATKVLSLCYVENGWIVAGTDEGHVYLSKNCGATWTDKGQLGTNTAVNALAYLGSGIVIAGCEKTADYGALYKSTDYGATWSLVLQGTGGNGLGWVTCLCSVGGGVVLAGTTTYKIFRSTDSGANWTDVYTDPGATGNMKWGCLANLGGGIVFAGSVHSGASQNKGEIHKSTDSGATWSLVGQLGSEEGIYSMVTDLSAMIIAGTGPNGKIYRSLDSGVTWTLIQQLGSETEVYALVFLGGPDLIAGTNPLGYLYKTNDYGTTWLPLQRLGAETSVHALASMEEHFVGIGTAPGGLIYRMLDLNI